MQVIEDYYSADECRRLLDVIDDYRREHPPTDLYRPVKGRSLRYSVINGEQIRKHLPELQERYTGEFLALVNRMAGEKLEPLANLKSGVNVNILPSGRSEYRWHYDRNYVTAILYLNEVQGGDTEMYPNYRILLGNPSSRLQKILDGILNFLPLRAVLRNKVSVSPKAGRLVVMQGSRSWHSVSPVTGVQDRINIIMAYDRPGATFSAEKGLDSYLYTQQEQKATDPNYGR
ncbi:MAG: 2OG-Fe(II) oxygenase [Anaerolineales bacterium]